MMLWSLRMAGAARQIFGGSVVSLVARYVARLLQRIFETLNDER
jgi:hypothetical protein